MSSAIIKRTLHENLMADGQQVNVPPELENILLEYTIRVLVDEPEDIISHAADYFVALRDGGDLDDEESEEHQDISEKLGDRSVRRQPIVGERYGVKVFAVNILLKSLEQNGLC